MLPPQSSSEQSQILLFEKLTSPCYSGLANAEDRAMLGSNLSAVVGDEDMGAVQLSFVLPLSHVFVPKAINPGGLGDGPQVS